MYHEQLLTDIKQIDVERCNLYVNMHVETIVFKKIMFMQEAWKNVGTCPVPQL